jgi:hypothetical protein
MPQGTNRVFTDVGSGTAVPRLGGMRPLSIAAPLFLLAYGVLRWVDGRNGQRKDGLAWDAGHVAFLVSMVLFAVLAVVLAGRAPGANTTGRRLAAASAVGAVLGAGCFIWVIIGDLSERFSDRWPLPGPLEIAGPLLFVLGMLVLLGQQVAAGRAPLWSPIAFFVGYLAISVSLDLLPFAALLILASTAPLARPSGGSPRAIPAGSR